MPEFDWGAFERDFRSYSERPGSSALTRARPPLSPVHIQQDLVQPRLARQLRMEGDRQQVALADGHRVSIDPSQDLDPRAVLCHPRRADEHGMDRAAVQAVERQIGLE